MNPVELLQDLAHAEIQVMGVTNDSREVIFGDLFLAYPGEFSDGRNYIQAAIEKGASAVFWDPASFAWPKEYCIPNYPVCDLKKSVSAIAASIYGKQVEKVNIIGVTGTNGKTSVTQWVTQALAFLGYDSAVFGTLGIGRPGRLKASKLTTADAATLYREMAKLGQDGVSHMAMEVSSIGVEEGRISGVNFSVAVLTNFTQDHLDYHKDMQSYWQAKEKLFYWPSIKWSILNLDDPTGYRLAQKLLSENRQVIGFSLDKANCAGWAGNCVYAESIEQITGGQQLTFSDGTHRSIFKTNLVGKFNVSNLLAVTAVLQASCIEWDDIIRALGQLCCVDGRMMCILPDDVFEQGALPTVIVDYAHTPDALENVLKAVREMAETQSGKIWTVFGCGGDRDQEKRPLMGEIAARLSHEVIVTDDNPRFESPESIRSMIVQGMSKESALITEIADRKQAIDYAIYYAKPQDIVLLAGKGHEDYQEIRGERHPLSDIKIAKEALKERLTS